MIVGTIDLGQSHPVAQPVVGQTTGSIFIEGVGNVHWPRGSVGMHQTVNFTINAWFAIGGAAANTMNAARFLVRQMEELADNPMWQPVYIQWTTTANGAALYSAFEYHDGWYIIENFAPDYGHNIVTSQVKCTMTVSRVAPSLARNAIYWMGAALSSNYSGATLNLVAFPFGSTALDFGTYGGFRNTAEGSIGTQTPAVNPTPFVPPTALANYWKGGVHMYDTLNTGSNPIPTTGGTFINANWVEVFGTDHDFIGDCVITNGLLLLQFGASTAVNSYVWNTALPLPNWHHWGDVYAYDQSGNGATIRSYSPIRVGSEECAVTLIWSTSIGQVQKTILRVQRGRYEARLDLTPLTQAETTNLYLNIAGTNGNNRITYNPSHVGDAAFAGEGALAVDTQYGYGAHFLPNASFPTIFGYLYQNQPGTNQPNAFANSSLTLGDTVALPVNVQRSYAFFAIPYGTNGAYTTANLQGECESFTLSGGFANVVDAGSSGGHAAKLPSGTAVGAIALGPGAAYDSAAQGAYDLWIRIRVTSAASGTTQLRLGFYDGTAAAFIVSTDYAPSNFTTSYAWYRINNGFNLVLGGHSLEFRAISVTNAAATDFWLDQMVLVPKTLTQDNRGPQDLWQQFMFDRSTKWIRQ